MNNNSNTLNENYPYEHLIIENVFKEDFYKKLKKKFPENKLFKPCNNRVKGVRQDERFVIFLDKKDDFKLLKNQKFWLEFYKSFYDKKFLKNIFKNFNLDLKNKFHIQVQLIYDKKNLILPPHTDVIEKKKTHKYITFLMYVVEDEKLNLSTELYKIDKDGTINSQNKTFKICKKAPYKDNTALVFVPKNDVTWHGVSEIKNNVIRRTIQVFFKPKKDILYDKIYEHKF